MKGKKHWTRSQKISGLGLTELQLTDWSIIILDFLPSKNRSKKRKISNLGPKNFLIRFEIFEFNHIPLSKVTALTCDYIIFWTNKRALFMYSRNLTNHNRESCFSIPGSGLGFRKLKLTDWSQIILSSLFEKSHIF